MRRLSVTTPGRGDAGFTMVELLVGLVLATIVMALLFGVVLDMFGASERSAMDGKAQRSATHAADMLTADLRAMRAPQREPRYTGSPDNLRSMLLRGINPNGYEVHDLLVARPDQVTFYAELVNTAGNSTVECVSWFVRPDGGLQRDVRRYAAGCPGGGGAVIQSELIMPPPERARATAAATVPNPFSFKLLRVANTNDPDPSTCTTPPPAPGPLTGVQLDQVTNVDMDLRSFVAGRMASGDQHLQSSVTITSRQGMEYRYAIGCAS